MDKMFPSEYDLEFIKNARKLIKKIKDGKITIRSFEVATPDDQDMYFNFSLTKIKHRKS